MGNAQQEGRGRLAGGTAERGHGADWGDTADEGGTEQIERGTADEAGKEQREGGEQTGGTQQMGGVLHSSPSLSFQHDAHRREAPQCLTHPESQPPRTSEAGGAVGIADVGVRRADVLCVEDEDSEHRPGPAASRGPC